MIMKLEQKFCFTEKPGEDIYLFTLRNEKGEEASITNYGAILTSFKIKDKNGSTQDIVLGFDTVEEYKGKAYLENYPWFGAATGRYCNRIKNARFEIDGSQYKISKNKGADCLHGGVAGFDKKCWKLKSSGERPFPFVELTYTSPDGEEGFPGNLEVDIRFELNNDSELSYEYKAVCDAPTAVNLTHHSYFNLNGGEGTIKEHLVRLYASGWLEQDDNLVANGKIKDVAGTVYDFRELKKIADGLKIVEEFDQSFVIEEVYTAKPVLVAEAVSPKTDIRLQIFSTEPVIHFYSGKWIPRVKGKNGVQYGAFSGLCLETHKHPNAINIPHFANTILRPGEMYSQKTIYKLLT